jgi:hypothetical protein
MGKNKPSLYLKYWKCRETGKYLNVLFSCTSKMFFFRVFLLKVNMFRILKLKRAKNSYGGYPTDFFSRARQKFQAAPKLLENIPKYTKENKIKSKLILICTVLNKK